MKIISKYHLKDLTEQRVTFSGGGKVLSIADEEGGIALFVLQDPALEDRTDYLFHVYKTGENLPEILEDKVYLGTVGSRIDFHVFAGGKAPVEVEETPVVENKPEPKPKPKPKPKPDPTPAPIPEPQPNPTPSPEPVTPEPSVDPVVVDNKPKSHK